MAAFVEPLAACALTLMCAGGPTPPESSLMLTLTPESGPGRTALLNCQPASGTHPEAATACATLDAAGGVVAEVEPRNQQCVLIYSPVRAEAHGHWRGARVDFSAEFANPCHAAAKTSGVFDF